MSAGVRGLVLLTTDNPKILKGEKIGYLSAVLHLAPNKVSGRNVCPMASKGCIASCLFYSGRGAMQRTQNARIRRTNRFFDDRDGFMADIVIDIVRLIQVAKHENKKLAIRLNGTSDIRWEVIPVNGYANVMEMFPDIQFYDYTKIPNRRNLPANYHLTFSLNEKNCNSAIDVLNSGGNVAAVFAGKLPKRWSGFKVIDGDKNDLRFLDPSGVVIGLSPKGRAKKDVSGFVIHA